MTASFLSFRYLGGRSTSDLFRGFGDWRVAVLLTFYVLYGLSAGLMVKRLGAVSRALAMPVALGGCYLYSVRTGSSAFAIGAVLAWLVCVALICTFAAVKIRASRYQMR